MIGTKPGQQKYQTEQIFIDTPCKPSYTIEDETILFFEPAPQSSKDPAKNHDSIAASIILYALHSIAPIILK